VRSVPSDLQTRLNTGSSKAVWCFRITTKTGAIFRFTEGDVAAVFSGETFNPLPGFLGGTIAFGLDGNAAGIDLQFGATADTPITKADIGDGFLDAAEVDAYEYDIDFPEHGRVHFFWGRAGDIEHRLEGGVKLNVKGILNQSHEVFMERYVPVCVWFFCDEHCGLDPADFTHAATITAISDDRYTLVVSWSGGAPADNVCLDGVGTYTSGAREGVNFAIRGNSGTTLLTHLAVPGAVLVGDTLDVLQGCRKIYDATDGGTSCTFYGNRLRFGGQPRAGSPEEAQNITYSEWAG
jgi:uncharacterized phage protein (TIGR02218 family)